MILSRTTFCQSLFANVKWIVLHQYNDLGDTLSACRDGPVNMQGTNAFTQSNPRTQLSHIVLCPWAVQQSQQVLYPAVGSIPTSFWDRMTAFIDQNGRDPVDIDNFRLFDVTLLHEVSHFQTNMYI